MTNPIDPPDARDEADDVRQMLSARSRSITPRGTFVDVEDRLATSEDGRRRNRAVLAAAAAVVLVALAAGAIAFTNQDSDEPERINVADSSTTSVSSTSEPAPPATEQQTTTTVATTTNDPEGTPSTDDTVGEAPSAEAISEQTRVRIDGIGPITVPMTVAEASVATGQDVVIDPNSRIDETSRCGFAQIEGLPGIWFMVDGDRITRVDITGTGVPNPTAAGVGVGSNPAEVRAAYPGMVTEEPHPYAMDENSRYLVVTDPARDGFEIIFSVHQGAVVDYRSGLADWVAMPEGCA